MEKLPMFEGPLKGLNTLRQKADELQERIELRIRQRERQYTLASISDLSKINSRATFNDLDTKHQWLKYVEELISNFLAVMEKDGITYKSGTVCVQDLKLLRQEILDDINLLRDK